MEWNQSGVGLWHRRGAKPPESLYIERNRRPSTGPSVGSCGTAAYRAEQVIVSDIATDPLWAGFQGSGFGAFAPRFIFHTPIFSAEGKVIGTFAMYYGEPRSPSPREQDTIKHITHLAGVAIQRRLAEAALRESEAYLAEAQRLSHTGSWAWAPATGEINSIGRKWEIIADWLPDPHEAVGSVYSFSAFVRMTKSESGNCSKALFAKKRTSKRSTELFTRAAPSRTSKQSAILFAMSPVILPNLSARSSM